MLAVLLCTYLITTGNSTKQNGEIGKKHEVQLLACIDYIEEDEALFDLGFDHYQCLPEDFDPFKGMIYTLDTIEYSEEETEAIEIGDKTIWLL